MGLAVAEVAAVAAAAGACTPIKTLCMHAECSEHRGESHASLQWWVLCRLAGKTRRACYSAMQPCASIQHDDSQGERMGIARIETSMP